MHPCSDFPSCIWLRQHLRLFIVSCTDGFLRGTVLLMGSSLPSSGCCVSGIWGKVTHNWGVKFHLGRRRGLEGRSSWHLKWFLDHLHGETGTPGRRHLTFHVSRFKLPLRFSSLFSWAPQPRAVRNSVSFKLRLIVYREDWLFLFASWQRRGYFCPHILTPGEEALKFSPLRKWEWIVSIFKATE